MSFEPDSLLHIVNGDDLAALLRQTDLPGEVIAWRDVLHEGPVPGGVRREQLRISRANFLASQGWGTYYGILNELVRQDQALDAARHGQYVLWFEADLSNQLRLCQVLNTLRQLAVAPQQIYLICVGEFPGVVHFAGLGQLLPRNLIQLFDRRTHLNEEAISAGCAAWRAFCGADPTLLLRLGEDGKETLPYLSESFARLAQEYPSTANGLSLTQKHILSAIAERPASADRIVQLTNDQEKRPYLTDSICFAHIDTLVDARYPLIKGEENPAPVAKPKLFITLTGLDVLGNTQDHVALNGIDKWIGGVHLKSGSPGWRYNEELSTLMPSVL